ncbi:hypothetical protein [Aquabacter cavernae]|uniref:hypothetical protein n=1 Tax=Aquabacter cavernae TaxID=2496029 RepID=UPI000F8CFEB5|nr:hypothetical protein [Aquabacter cavernae]
MSATLDPAQIRTNLQAGVDAAATISMSDLPRREASSVSIDQILNMACGLAMLDTICATAAELLKTIEQLDLTDRASLARHALAGLLEQAGYVNFIQPEENNGSEN